MCVSACIYVQACVVLTVGVLDKVLWFNPAGN